MKIFEVEKGKMISYVEKLESRIAITTYVDIQLEERLYDYHYTLHS